MTPLVLGLDIGGANLKAATADKRAVSVPFALWKQPDKLPAALADLVGQFPDAEELAVTMTGELCDCYETKREGVNAILDAVAFAAKGRPVRVWSTDGAFVSVEESRRDHMKVAAANWHALASYLERYVPKGFAVLLDIGSTTTDIIPFFDGKIVTVGRTDPERLAHQELLYFGVRRTPLCAILGRKVATELFATTLDVYLLLGMIPENRCDTDTADGKPATQSHAHARIARMKCSDSELMTIEDAKRFSQEIHDGILDQLNTSLTLMLQSTLERLAKKPQEMIFLVSGSGDFLIRKLFEYRQREPMNRLLLPIEFQDRVYLKSVLGPTVSACAPAYALAVLATERRP